MQGEIRIRFNFPSVYQGKSGTEIIEAMKQHYDSIGHIANELGCDPVVGVLWVDGKYLLDSDLKRRDAESA